MVVLQIDSPFTIVDVFRGRNVIIQGGIYVNAGTAFSQLNRGGKLIFTTFAATGLLP